MYCKQAVMAMQVLLHRKHCNKYGNASIIAWQVLLRCNKAGSDCDVFLFHTKYYTKLIYLYDNLVIPYTLCQKRVNILYFCRIEFYFITFEEKK